MNTGGLSQEQEAYMLRRVKMNAKQSHKNAAENWAYEQLRLKTPGLRWTRQRMYRFRIFDFWCEKLGIAVEVDGKRHLKPETKLKDTTSDEELLNFHSIIVLRVRDFNDEDMDAAVKVIMSSKWWEARKYFNPNITLDTLPERFSEGE